MNDDTGILIFLAGGAVVLAGIVVFGVLSSRRKAKATVPLWTIDTDWIGAQPFLVTTDLALDDGRQEELFRQAYVVGDPCSATVLDEKGVPIERQVHVSRISRSLRGGWPLAKLGLTVYFREWEDTEFPVSFRVKGSDKVVEIAMDTVGVVARDATGATVWTAPWSTLLFSNGPDIVLSDGAAKTIRFERSETSDLEEIIIKYGNFKQMHF